MRKTYRALYVVLTTSLATLSINVIIIAANGGDQTTFSDMLVSPRVSVGATIALFLHVITIITYLGVIKDLLNTVFYRTQQFFHAMTTILMLLVLLINVREHNHQHIMIVLTMFISATISDVLITNKSYTLSIVSALTSIFGIGMLTGFSLNTDKVWLEYIGICYFSLCKLIKMIVFSSTTETYDVNVTIEQVKSQRVIPGNRLIL